MTLTNHLPIGSFENDSVAIDGCVGWAKDNDTPDTSVVIHFYIDGVAGTGTLIGSTNANIYRSDVGYHGFKWTIPNAYLEDYKNKKIWAYAIDTTGGSNPELSGSPIEIGVGPSGNQYICNTAGNSTIEIRTSTRFAGAIESLIWNGKEFIDKNDHGRELQSASSFNGHGECFNPTEAGSECDGTGMTSTSVLREIYANGNVLTSTTQMAFWRPGSGSTQCPGGCQTPINDTDLSNHILKKRVEIGLSGMAHVIRYDIDFLISEDETYNSGTFEILTGYMVPAFSKFYTYDKTSHELADIDNGPGEQPKPIIFSTPDGLYAMGIFYKDEMSYGRWSWVNVPTVNCVKWNSVYRATNILANSKYSFTAYVIVGSLQNVKDSMDQLNP